MDNEQELDFDAVAAELNRRAYDKELEALANLTLLRSAYSNETLLTQEEQEKRDLEERIRTIIDGLVRE